jgi:hypothetical protein
MSEQNSTSALTGLKEIDVSSKSDRSFEAVKAQMEKDKRKRVERKKRATQKRKALAAEAKKKKTTTEKTEANDKPALQFDLQEQRVKISQMFLNITEICERILSDGMKDHTALSASMLNVIFRLLGQAQDSFDQLVLLEDDIEKDAAIAEYGTDMTPEEAAMVYEFEQRSKEMDGWEEEQNCSGSQKQVLEPVDYNAPMRIEKES